MLPLDRLTPEPLDRLAQNVYIINNAVRYDDSLFPLSKMSSSVFTLPIQQSSGFHTSRSLMGRAYAIALTGLSGINLIFWEYFMVGMISIAIIKPPLTALRHYSSTGLKRDIMDFLITSFIPPLCIGRVALGIIHPGFIFDPDDDPNL